MKNIYLPLLLIVSLFVLAGSLFHFKVGWLLPGDSTLENPKEMGYCFDVAIDPTREQLYIAAGQSGLHILDTVNGKLEHINTYYGDGYYRNLKILGERAYIADSKRGLVVLDISGESPVTTWVQTDGKAGGLHLDGDMVYVAAFSDGLQIFEISDPDTPVLIASLGTLGDAWDVWVHAGFAYIADTNAGMTVIDISTPSEPSYVGTTTWADRYQNAEIIRGEGNTVYIAAGTRGFITIDISDPLQPVVSSIYRPTRIAYAEGLAVRNGIVYLAMGSEFLKISTIENGLHIFDATDPYSLILLGKARFLDWPEGVLVAGNIAYVANTWTGARSIDINDPTQPYIVDTFNQFPHP
jgi:hypothetical protein